MEIFSRKKYIFLTIILIVLTLGFVLMAGPKNTGMGFDPEIFSFRRITLAPIIILGAYGLLILVIFRKN